MNRLLALACALACLIAAPSARARDGNENRAAQWVEAHRNDEAVLRRFVALMPKGADLHTHLSGAVYAERYLEWGARLGFCVDAQTLALLPAPCEGADGATPLARIDTAMTNRLIDRLSTRNYALSGQSGHDQFFSTFGRFAPISGRAELLADMVQDVVANAGAQNVLHVELMHNFAGSGETADPGAAGWTDAAFAAAHERLKTPALAAAIAQARRRIDDVEAELRARNACGEKNARPACAVSLRWIQQVIRVTPQDNVFAQIIFAAELARVEPRILALNLVAPEDDPVALRDYALHMRMVRYARSVAPAMKVTLHAGELALGLVPPTELRSHIRDAIRVGGAARIGHGVGIAHEVASDETLDEMRRQGVAVEINLTSNDVILGVKGDAHPLRLYRLKGVPVTLNTDDEGVSRIDLTHEYIRALREHGLTYRDLKQVSRNGLTYSFLPGASLWADATQARPAAPCLRDRLGGTQPSRGCKAFLATSERARRQWELEASFTRFETQAIWR